MLGGSRVPYQSVPEVVEALVAAYGDRLSAAAVSAVVLRTRDEIAGHILPEALPGMLWEVASHRLQALADAGDGDQWARPCSGTGSG